MASTASSAVSGRVRNPVLRALYFFLGLVCLALLPLSYLPGIPTFDLILLAAFFFSMSSERMHQWMLDHPYFGRVIRGYREYGLTIRMKWIAAVAISISIGVSGMLFVENTIVRLVMVGAWVYALWFVFTRPTRDLSTI